jgi:hypothetical protein
VRVREPGTAGTFGKHVRSGRVPAAGSGGGEIGGEGRVGFEIEAPIDDEAEHHAVGVKPLPAEQAAGAHRPEGGEEIGNVGIVHRATRGIRRWRQRSRAVRG